ncbi:MAG TPA: hypothetical protein VJX67_20370 [Blastocatellia bacterium]|nr:hypothetical protein [Blastocatellia bacterium]
MIPNLRYVASSLVLLIVCGTGYSQSKDVAFPLEHGVLLSDSRFLNYTADGRLGFALLVGQDLIVHKLFSFGVDNAAVLGQFDVTPDLTAHGGTKPPITFIRLDEQARVVFVYGTTAAGEQEIVAVSYDDAGHLAKLWVRLYPTTQFVSLAVTADGGLNLYAIYGQTGVSGGVDRLDLLETASGAVLASIPLSKAAQSFRSLVFDSLLQRAVALVDGSAFVFKPEPDGLDLDFVIVSIETSGEPLGVTPDGRFIVAFAGGRDNPVGDSFLVYDLEAHQAKEFHLPAQFFSTGGSLALSPDSGIIAATPTAGVRAQPGVVKVDIKPRRSVVIDRLSPDGTITTALQVRVPDASVNSGPNRIPPFSRPALSRSGALCFVPSINGHLFSLDTLTGEIIDDRLIGSNAASNLQLIEDSGLLSFGTGKNEVLLAGVSTGPSISGVKVRRKTTVITGNNFLVSVRVQFNGVDVENPARDPTDPGHRISVSQGREALTPGQPLRIRIINRDGLTSNTFTVIP